jgi:hypothetical protein
MADSVLAALSGFIKKAPATTEALSRLKAGVPYPLPDDYIDLLRSLDGGEGFIGEQFVRFYSVDEVLMVRQVLGDAQLASEFVIIGSDGGGEALAYDRREVPARLVTLGFIPLDPDFVEVVASSLAEYFDNLRPHEPRTRWWSFSRTQRPRTPNPALVGKEIHEIQPIIFGGDPMDRMNKEFLTLSEYLPVVVWWNRLYRDTKNQSDTSSGPHRG